MPTKCPFCEANEMVLSNELAYAIYDRFPVTEGHLLLIPRRHVTDYFETTHKERQALEELTFLGRTLLERKYRPKGYNVGINIGKAAGQTISHVHIHLIPRYEGDVLNPRGGVRGVIPEKQDYADDQIR